MYCSTRKFSASYHISFSKGINQPSKYNTGQCLTLSYATRFHAYQMNTRLNMCTLSVNSWQVS